MAIIIMKKIIAKSTFLAKYSIDPKTFEETKLKWEDLETIYEDYLKEIPKLEASAIYLFNR